MRCPFLDTNGVRRCTHRDNQLKNHSKCSICPFKPHQQHKCVLYRAYLTQLVKNPSQPLKLSEKAILINRINQIIRRNKNGKA